MSYDIGTDKLTLPHVGASTDPLLTRIGTDMFSCRTEFPIGNSLPRISLNPWHGRLATLVPTCRAQCSGRLMS
eukprot:10478004-Karenia_brevis.AAC.1